MLEKDGVKYENRSEGAVTDPAGVQGRPRRNQPQTEWRPCRRRCRTSRGPFGRRKVLRASMNCSPFPSYSVEATARPVRDCLCQWLAFSGAKRCSLPAIWCAPPAATPPAAPAADAGRQRALHDRHRGVRPGRLPGGGHRHQHVAQTGARRPAAGGQGKAHGAVGADLFHPRRGVLQPEGLGAGDQHAFGDYLKRYPRGARAGDAKLSLAQAAFFAKDYPTAAAGFRRVWKATRRPANRRSCTRDFRTRRPATTDKAIGAFEKLLVAGGIRSNNAARGAMSSGRVVQHEKTAREGAESPLRSSRQHLPGRRPGRAERRRPLAR